MFKKMLFTFFILSALLFYSLIGFYILPPLAKKQLIQSIEKVLNQKASIDSVSFNPFTFTLSIHRLSLSDDKTQKLLAGIEDIEVDIDPFYLLLKEIKIASVTILKPSLFIRKNKEGELNLSDLLRINGKDQDGETQKTELANIVIEKFVITEGKIDITDDSGEKTVFQSLTLSRASLNDFTTIKKSKNELQLFMQADDGSDLEYTGRIGSVEPLQIEGEIELHGIKMHTYWKYVQDSLGFVVTKGAIDASVAHKFTFSGEKTQLDINKYKIELTNLLLEEKGTKERLLDIPLLVLKGSADITNANYPIKSVDAEAVFLKLRQNGKGEINWASYFPKQNAQESESSAIAWDIETLKIKDAKVDFEDEFNAKSGHVALDDIQLYAEGLSSKKQSVAKSTLSFRVNKTGKIETKSTIRHTPLKIETALKMNGLELLTFQAYLDKYADIKINSGVANLDLKAVIADENRSFLANAQIDRLSLSRPHEKSAFLTFTRLLAKNIDYSADSEQVKISRLDLVSPYLGIDIDADEKTNFSGIMHVQSRDPAKTNTSDDESIEFLIDKIMLKDGEVAFTDRSLKVPFKSNINAFNGSIIAVGSQSDVKSVLNLEGTINKYALAKIKGSLLPAQPKAFTEMDLELKNINMSNLSSYSSHFIGYTLKKGKLNADLSYRVNNAQMKSSNKIVLKNLELGKKVQSNTEVLSSIELALSLLKDSQGVIDIDVPISGDLNSPDFAIAPLVLKAFKNLTVGIATAPFRFIGSIVGIDAQKLENIYFEAGKAELLPPEREILEALSGVLIEKKSLLLSISGAYNEAHDGMQMRKNKVYAEVLRRFKDEKTDITQIQRDELDKLLKDLYIEYFDEEKYAREKKSVEAKKLDEQTKREMLHTQIIETLAKEQGLKQTELETLAQERGESILNYLRSKGVEAGRLKLLKTTKTELFAPKNAYIPSRLTLGVKK